MTYIVKKPGSDVRPAPSSATLLQATARHIEIELEHILERSTHPRETFERLEPVREHLRQARLEAAALAAIDETLA